jgi:superfamily II DNA or RNA helicase
MNQTYISKKGYVLKKDTFSKEIIDETKRELIAKPLTDGNFVTSNKDFPVYIETINNLYIPKIYGINKFGKPQKQLKSYMGSNWNNTHLFTGTLLNRQNIPFTKLLNACREFGGGLLQLNAGAGKTFITIKVISELKTKTLIIVNKIPLMHQWAEEISILLPSIKIGFLQGQSKIDVVDCDIVVAMLQSISRIDYPDELFSDFRTVVFDEVHNFSSQSFSKILFKVCCPYSIALSATPQRSDGCDYIINWHVGNLVYKGSVERIGMHPKLHIIKTTSLLYKEIKQYNSFQKKDILQFTSMISKNILIKIEKF